MITVLQQQIKLSEHLCQVRPVTRPDQLRVDSHHCFRWLISGPPLSCRLDRHNAKVWIESPKIIRIRRNGLLTGSARADHNMGVHNIGRPARSK